MKSGGDKMVVGIKDAVKLIGISIISCCAVLVCTMFLNFYFDILPIKDKIISKQVMILYDAQVSTAKVVCIVSGGCLLVTSVIMLLFYVKNYIDTHKKNLGILKALGYSNFEIAKYFWVFGTSVFIGAFIGFCAAFLIMPKFYELQNENKTLPEVAIHFHLSILIYFVILPTLAFSALAVLYACLKLKRPTLTLLKDNVQSSSKIMKKKYKKEKDRLFIDDLKKNTLKTKKTLVFFIAFASFCFSAMTQMSFSMKDFSSIMMGAMILMIGIVLAFTTLFLAVVTVIRGNTKTIAMMRVFGYSQKECCKAILGGYRPVSYVGFAIGTVYQYILLKIMITVVFGDISGLPKYEFNVFAMIVSLVSFIVIYEILMYLCSERIKRISVKEIMTQ